jgi:transcriptional antiterminator RfaH
MDVGGNASTAPEPGLPELAWFCLRSQPKHEHIAAANLRLLENVEVFNPRIRFKRSTRRGPVWFVEALFPNYLFARFDWRHYLRLVHHAAGVAGVVHFGSRWPTISDEVIADLKNQVGTQELKVMEDAVVPGEEVQLSGGIFHGLQGVVTRLIPGRARVAILLEFLGRQTSVEVAFNSIVRADAAGPFRSLKPAAR